MIAKFTIGMCIAMHSYFYKVGAASESSYLLIQNHIIHEVKREFKQYWLIKYIDKNSIRVPIRFCEESK